MMRDFSAYIGRHEKSLIELVEAKLQGYAVPSISPKLVNAELGYAVEIDDIVDFLEELARDNHLFVDETLQCAASECENSILPDDLKQGKCQVCGQGFEGAGEPLAIRHYMTPTLASRDISWMIVIHGFNTRGPWQEKLSWLISNKLQYAAPVLIYKYGFERIGIFFRFRHKALVRKLGDDIRSAFEHSKLADRSEVPDVIIHSFGSLLFAKLLALDDFSDLKFGRIICAGSVINPNFDWEAFIESKRVDAVLCHCGGKDFPVRYAQFVIPDSGPAGRIGFKSPSVINVREDSYAHSTALEPRNLDAQLMNSGIWERFLTNPSGTFNDQSEIESPIWNPSSHLVKSATRALFLSVAVAIALSLWYLLALLNNWLFF